MGYRHSLYIIEKEKVNNLTKEDIDKIDSRYDMLEYLQAKEIIDLGKYSDEGFELGRNGMKVEGLLEDFRKAMYYEGDSEFEFLEPEKLAWLAEEYLEGTINYWNKLLSDEPMQIAMKTVSETGEKCKAYVADLLHWSRYMLNTNIESKYILQTTWKYEYEIYNIIHCYKTIDWNKYYLVLIGG